MSTQDIEQSIHEAIDANDSATLLLYAEYAAEHLHELGEVLCTAIIGTEPTQWAALLAAASHHTPAIADALEAVEAHIHRGRDAFVGSRAQRLADLAEHDAQCRAELDHDLRRAS